MFRLVRLSGQSLAIFVFALSGLFGLAFAPLGVPALLAAFYLGVTSPQLRRLMLGGAAATRWWTAAEATLLIGVLWVIWEFVLFSTSDQTWLVLVPLGMVGLAGIGFALATLPRPGRMRDGLAAGAVLLIVYPGSLIVVGLAFLAVTSAAEDSDGRALRLRMQVIFALMVIVAALGFAAWSHQRSQAQSR